MDMVMSRRNGRKQRWEELIAISVGHHLVGTERQGEVLIDKQVNEGLIVIWNLQVRLFDEAQHRAPRQFVKLTLTNKPLLTGVDAKKQVKDNANHRYEPYH